MLKSHFSFTRSRIAASGIRWQHIAALALFLAMSVTARAANDRAIRSKVQPTYPELAKRMKIAGIVRMEATVDAEGKVTAVKTISGSRALSTAAEEAVSKWKYAPGEGSSTVDVEVTFALAQ